MYILHFFLDYYILSSSRIAWTNTQSTCMIQFVKRVYTRPVLQQIFVCEGDLSLIKHKMSLIGYVVQLFHPVHAYPSPLKVLHLLVIEVPCTCCITGVTSQPELHIHYFISLHFTQLYLTHQHTRLSRRFFSCGPSLLPCSNAFSLLLYRLHVSYSHKNRWTCIIQLLVTTVV